MKQTIPALAALVLGTALAQTQSLEQADATLAKVEQARARVEAEFADSERDCYTRFFVNACLDKAKEKRHGELTRLRAQEVEANHFKREDSVKRRDAELAERARKDAEEQAARMAAEARAVKAVKPEAEEAPKARTSGPTVAEREAQHEAKVKRQEAEDAANAGKRAANRAAFEKKAADAQRRQAEVARKKEEAEQKRAAQEEAERKKVNKP